MKSDSLFPHDKIYIYRLQELLLLLILAPLLAVSVITGHLLRGPTKGPLPLRRSHFVPICPCSLVPRPLPPVSYSSLAIRRPRQSIWSPWQHSAAEQPFQNHPPHPPPINKNKTKQGGGRGGGRNNDSFGLMERSSCQRLEIRLEAEAHKPQRCAEAAGASG